MCLKYLSVQLSLSLKTLQFIEDNMERYAAEMEAVNIRAEQLSEVCKDSMIPKRQISLLNKKLKLVSYQLEQSKRPEEKGTGDIQLVFYQYAFFLYTRKW